MIPPSQLHQEVGRVAAASLTKPSRCRLLAAAGSSAWETVAVEAMGKTSMAAVVGRDASAVGKTSVAALVSAVLVEVALLASTAALASIVGHAGLANSGIEGDHEYRPPCIAPQSCLETF